MMLNNSDLLAALEYLVAHQRMLSARQRWQVTNLLYTVNSGGELDAVSITYVGRLYERVKSASQS